MFWMFNAQVFKLAKIWIIVCELRPVSFLRESEEEKLENVVHEFWIKLGNLGEIYPDFQIEEGENLSLL